MGFVGNGLMLMLEVEATGPGAVAVASGRENASGISVIARAVSVPGFTRRSALIRLSEPRDDGAVTAHFFASLRAARRS